METAFSADVLLARRKREDETALAVFILRFADDAAGHAPHERLGRPHDAQIGPPKFRSCPALSLCADNVRALLAGLFMSAHMTGSACTMQSAPASCARSAAFLIGYTSPEKPG